MNAAHKITRRDFLKISGAMSLALAAPIPFARLAEAGPGKERFVQTRLRMGTMVTLTIAADSATQAKEAAETAWSEMDRLIAIFDRHRPGTAISELNAAGRLSDPGPEMIEVLNLAAKVHRLSDGAFDPTVLPLLELIEKSFQASARPPAEAELAEALRVVDFGSVKFSKSGVNMNRAGQKLSLDGVAKGYIVDRIGAKLREAGIKNALINAGGDILALGHRRAGHPWRVAIQDPLRAKKILRVINLSDQAVATSGSYEIYFDRKHEFHHLLNPALGRPAVKIVSATAVASSTALADALSTAAFIQPKVFSLSEKIQGMIVARNGRLALTQGFKRLLVRS